MFKQFVVVAALATVAVPVGAVTQIMSPNPTYLDDTALLGVPAPTGPTRTSVTDGILKVDFSSALRPRRVGINWNTWGTPPDTEASKPSVWFSQAANSVTFTFDNPLSIWGFEVQGNPYDLRTFTLDFYDGAALIGTITRTINGNGGARLMAGQAGVGEKFTSVKLSSNTSFAIAQLRYQLSVIPEPATWGLLIAGFAMVGVAARRRRHSVDSLNA